MKYVLPRIRSMITKELIDKYGLTQMEVASKLKVTQAAVSYYLSSKRGSRVEAFERDPHVEAKVKEIADLLVRGGGTPDEVVKRLCSMCMALRAASVICDLHRTAMRAARECLVCPELFKRPPEV